MASIQTDRVQLIVGADTKGAINQLGYLQAEYKKLEEAKRTATTYTQEQALNNAMGVMKEKIEAARKELGLLGLSQKELTRKIAEHNREAANRYAIGSEQAKQHKAEAQMVKDLITAEQRDISTIKETIKVNGIRGLTTQQLINYSKHLQDELIKEADLTSDLNKKRIAEFQQSQALINSRQTSIKGASGLFTNLKGNIMSSLIGGVVGGAAGGGVVMLIEKIIGFVPNLIRARAEIEKAIGGLAAITGLDLQKDAADIDFYKKSVKELSREFQVAGLEIYKAIQIVGSVKPELLKQKEALVSVTADVIMLSKASGGMLDIKSSAEAVTGSLNQFGESASQSKRFVNVLAAGAKEGASEIQMTAEAFKKSGAVLKASNVSFEESNALVQVLSTKMIRGEEAGTALRNIFAKLLTGSNELNPAIHGVNDVLEKLSTKSPAELMKMFGQESVVAAMELIKARKEVDRLTDAVSNTNEAFDQFKKQTDNLSGDLDQLSASSSRFWTTLTSQSGGWMRGMTQGLSIIIDRLGETFKYFDGNFAKMAGNYTLDKAVEQVKKNDIERQKKAETNIRIKMESAAQLEVGAAKDKVRKQVLQRELEQAREEFDATNKVYSDLKKKKSDKEFANNALEERKLIGQKIIFAKEELARIEKNEAENKELLKRIKNEAPDDKKVNDAKKLQEEVAKNEAKLIDEIEKMHINSIEDETKRNIEKHRADFNREVDANFELVEAKKLSKSSYESWLEAAEKQLEIDIDQIKQKAREKQEKEDLEAARTTAKLVAEAQLSAAEAAGDDQLILVAKIALRKQQFDVDIEKATADQKLLVWEKYLSDVQKLEIDASSKRNKEQLASDEAYFKEYSTEGEKWIEKRKQAEKAFADAKTNFLQAAESAVFDISNSFFERRIQKLENSTNKELLVLTNKKNQGLITEEEYNTGKERIEKRSSLEIAKVRRKMEIASKAAAILEIAIKTAQAIAELKMRAAIALANPATAVFGATYLGAIPFVLGAGALSAGAIAAKPVTQLPSLDVGGWMPKEWSFPVNDGKGGGLMIGHPNEFVLNAKATSSPTFAAIRPILESANAGQSISSISGGGVGPVASGNNDIFGKLADAMTMNSNAIVKLESKLDDLKVRLAPQDFEYIGEEINYQSGINNDAMIYNTKL